MLPTERLDYSPIAGRRQLDIAGRRADGGVGHRQCRGMGPQRADAAHRPDPAGGRLADARHPELGVARIRQPGRVLADARGVRRAAQCRAVLAINGSAIARYRADRRAPPSTAAGNSSATASARRTCRRSPTSALDIRRTAAAIRERDRQEPARLARPRPDRDLGDARISWPRRATTMSATGCSTTSRCG